MVCHTICPPALARLLGCHRAKGSQRGKRPETFLTLYEMEQMPTMMRELEGANRHFWQMVCWRWRQQQMENSERKAKAEQHKGGKRGSQQKNDTSDEEGSPKASPKPKVSSPDDSYTDGCALRELVRALSKTMADKGTFDAEAEQMLAEFRARLLGYALPSSGGSGRRGSKVERRREFAKMRTISHNSGLGASVDAAAKDGGQGKTSSSSSSAASSSSGYSSSADGTAAVATRRTRAAQWLRQRAHSVRDRRCVCCVDNERLASLGEVLCGEFHSTVFSHSTEFDVHERELKLLVWRRFTQMLVAVLTDRERFGQGSSADEKRLR